MESSLTLFRVRGIPIGINWSWILIFALLTWALGAAFYPIAYPGLDGSVYLAMALATAALFFGSILAHELGHALVGLREGVRIEGITLWLFGGVAKMSGRVPSPGAELRITGVGPLISIALAAGFGVLALAAEGLGWPEPAIGVLEYMTRINAILAAFNLVPALPLDGGRLLHAWLWRRQGDQEAATVSAAGAGRAFGYLLIAVGLLGLFTGAGLGGLWFVFLGWFLVQMAQAEASSAIVRSTFHGRRVGDLMTPDPEVVPPSLTIEEFLERASAARGHSTYPVADDWRLLGLISVRMAGATPREARAATRVTEVMLPAERVATVPPETAMEDALERLREEPGRAVVLADGRIAGLLSRSDVARAVQLREAIGVERPAPARKAGPVVWIVVGTIMLVAAGALYRPPLAVLSPGPAVDVGGDVTISGTEVSELTGRYLLTAVRAERPTALGALLAYFDPSREIVSISAIAPPGVDPDRMVRERREQFLESQLLAAAAAARAAGMEVGVDGSGGQVVGVVPDTPADGVLEPGDVIVEVDGRLIRLAADVRDAIRGQPAGTSFIFGIERGARRIDVEVRSERLQLDPETPVGVGVVLQTRGLEIDLPFQIEFRDRDVGGPSAGLAYALLVTDLLDPDDLAGGRTIAGTGTVDVEGNVGPVGGVGGKVESARDVGADLFFVPIANGLERTADDVRVEPVASLEEALGLLRG